jgi:hypothetical protein
MNWLVIFSPAPARWIEERTGQTIESWSDLDALRNRGSVLQAIRAAGFGLPPYATVNLDFDFQVVDALREAGTEAGMRTMSYDGPIYTIVLLPGEEHEEPRVILRLRKERASS